MMVMNIHLTFRKVTAKSLSVPAGTLRWRAAQVQIKSVERQVQIRSIVLRRFGDEYQPDRASGEVVLSVAETLPTNMIKGVNSPMECIAREIWG